MIEKQKTRDFWQQIANDSSVEESLAGMLSDGDPYISRLRQEGEEAHFIREFDLNTKMKLLEVGTGGGRWAFFLSDKVESVVGLDFSSKMIELANRALTKRNQLDNVSFEVAELTEYQSDTKFDVVYFSGMLQYLTDDEVINTVAHAKSLLSATGYFISRDSVQGLERVVLDAEHSVIYRTVDEYRELFRTGGFEMTYNEVSYPETRFSTFASKLYRLPLINYTIAHGIHKILLGINNLLGDPRWLMKSHHKEALATVGVRDHRFFRYELSQN